MSDVGLWGLHFIYFLLYGLNLPLLIKCVCHLAGECRQQCLFGTEENAPKKLELEGIKLQVTFFGDCHAQCQKAVLDFLGELFV